MSSKSRSVNAMLSPSMKRVNTIEYDYPTQNDVDEVRKEKHNIWLEMIKNKRNRSLNRADRRTK
jgi:hypothetical protein|tara:strand:+ start:89 stop:280 length:192 start_codon:yes stop_codon:yes gene_type:complete